MITPLSQTLADRLRAFAQSVGGVSAPRSPNVFSFRCGDRLVIPVGASHNTNPEELVSWFRENPLPEFADPEAYEIVVAVADVPWTKSFTIGRGIRLVSLHAAIARLAGMPDGWRDNQQVWLSQTLSPLKINGVVHIGRLWATGDDRTDDAVSRVEHWFDQSRSGAGKLLYLRAEAGKGKSTILAFTVERRLNQGRGPLPIYIPLRTLQRDVGISWGEIAARLGVVGTGADIMAKAVKHGLVVLALDGLDEVAGRYDPTIVRAVLDVVEADLLGPDARLVLSGRTTESGLLAPATSRVVGIELPAPSDPEFRAYATLVVNHVVPQWPELSTRVPEPDMLRVQADAAPPEEWQLDRIREWIEAIFTDFGKDRSLFFVQSLACIGRNHQLQGNRRLLIETGGSVRGAEVSLYEVCVLAAALACIREQDKIEELAQRVFTPAAQLELLTWLAVRASAGEGNRIAMPVPLELARVVFGLDTTVEHEEFTAVVRQMHKHALLFSGVGEGLRAGDWRPQFLSEWVRAALLCRAWQLADDAPGGVALQIVEDAIASAERSRIAFQYIFPDLARQNLLRAPEHLVERLRILADEESPEAAANYWTLVAGSDGSIASIQSSAPAAIPPMTDLSDLTIENLTLGGEFSGTLALFANAQFLECTLSNVAFDQCDFTAAGFSGCIFNEVTFNTCDGPITFEDCEFHNCEFADTRTRTLPALTFSGCVFDSNSRIRQDKSPGHANEYGPVVAFEESAGSATLSELLQGDWLGVDARRLEGYQLPGAPESGDPVEACLRALLKPFFPRRAGTDAQLQARPYIRSSAVGRGRLPNGAPSPGELTDILFQEGFTDGGREAHIYAPWSSVAGASAQSIELRNEFLAFLRGQERTSSVTRILGRIRRAGQW
jgi:hypothetical protein